MSWFKFNNDNTTNLTCDSLYSNTTNTNLHGWQGIPVNLTINTVIFAFMILLFAFIRNKAWNRKSSQLTRIKRGWLQFIYGDREGPSEPKRPFLYNEPHDHHENSNILLPPTLNDMAIHRESSGNIETCVNMQCDPDNIERNTITNLEVDTTEDTHLEFQNPQTINRFNNHSDASSELPPTSQARRPKSLFDRSISTTEFGYLLCDTLCIKDRDILIKRGSDAVQYLLFQRYIIYFLSFLTVISLFIVLPINLQGNQKLEKGFAQTTIGNLGNSPFLWAHFVISISMLPIGIILMCHFSKTIKEDEQRNVKRTLYIRRIPKVKRSREQLMAHLQKMFPDIVIEGIQFVYNTRRLQALHLDYNSMVNAKYYCDEYKKEFHKHCEIYPYFMGHLGPFACCGCHKVNGIRHYETREQELEREIEKEFRNCISEPSGSAFITLQTEKMAQKVYRHLRKSQEKSCSLLPCSCCFRLGTWLRKLINSYQHDEFETSQWLVSYAPYPDDINWDDIEVDYKLIWMRRIGIHVLLIFLFVFLSTPTIFISILNNLKIQESLHYGLTQLSPLVAGYLGPFMLVIAAIILPSFVILASRYLPYKTLSDLNHSVMWKTFFFLIMMVIFLPSLGLSSAGELLKSFTQSKQIRLECLFPVDNGALFVNYVLQSALLGNAMELLRFPELFLYIFYYLFYSKTPAEYENARQQIIFDFQFGIRYPRFLLIFCMVVTYSLACPLIVPCGLLYMIIKHLVDRYNIYFVYTPSKINGRIHSTAITFFHIGILMMIVQVLTFCYMNTRNTDLKNVTLVALIIATIIFCGHCFFHCICNINHLTYSATGRRMSKKGPKEFCACSYLPSVLLDLNVNGIVPPESHSNRNYGALNPSATSSATSCESF